MNDKIKELRNKALLLVQEDLETVERDHVVSIREHLEMVNEKFADLIIDECVSICEKLGDDKQDGHYCADSIKTKFGVK